MLGPGLRHRAALDVERVAKTAPGPCGASMTSWPRTVTVSTISKPRSIPPSTAPNFDRATLIQSAEAELDRRQMIAESLRIFRPSIADIPSPPLIPTFPDDDSLSSSWPEQARHDESITQRRWYKRIISDAPRGPDHAPMRISREPPRFRFGFTQSCGGE
jgi:hypothetical protein